MSIEVSEILHDKDYYQNHHKFENQVKFSMISIYTEHKKRNATIGHRGFSSLRVKR